MKYKILIITLILSVLTIISCQEKLNGKSEKDFKISKEKIEKKLNADEKIKLEKAIRVIALKAMVLKWDESKKYQGKSFNKIALELVDGLSYSSTTDLAEDFLQDRNKKEAEKLSAEIEKLEKKKLKLLNIEKKLNLFKIGHLFLNEIEWFGEMCPRLEIESVYIGKSELKGPVEISYELKEKSSKKILASGSWGYGDEDHVVKYDESLNGSLILCQAKERNPAIWKNIKYPIENLNFSKFDLELKIYVKSLYLNGEKVIKPKITTQEIDLEIVEQNKELKQILKSKGTLDELELTNN